MADVAMVPGLAAAGIVGEALKQYGEFTKLTQHVRGQTNITSTQLSQMRGQMVGFLRDYGQAVRDSGDAYRYAYNTQNQYFYKNMSNSQKARKEAQDSAAVVKESVKASFGTGDPASGIANTVGATLYAYNREASKMVGHLTNAQIVMAELHTGAADTNMKLGEFAKNLSGVLPIAANLNISLAQLGGMYATLTKAGISGPQAQTQVRGLLTQIQHPTPLATRNLETVSNQTGIDLVHAFSAEGIKQLGLPRVFQDLREALRRERTIGRDPTDVLSGIITQRRGLTGIFNLLSQQGMRTQQDVAGEMARSGQGQYRNPQGNWVSAGWGTDAQGKRFHRTVTDIMSDAYKNTLPGQLEILKGSWNSLMIDLGKTVSGPALSLLKPIIGAVQSLDKWLQSPANAKSAANFLKIALAVGAIGGGLRVAIGLFEVMNKLSSANPYMIAIIAATTLYIKWKPFHDLVNKTFGALNKVAGALAGFAQQHSSIVKTGLVIGGLVVAGLAVTRIIASIVRGFGKIRHAASGASKNPFAYAKDAVGWMGKLATGVSTESREAEKAATSNKKLADAKGKLATESQKAARQLEKLGVHVHREGSGSQAGLQRHVQQAESGVLTPSLRRQLGLTSQGKEMSPAARAASLRILELQGQGKTPATEREIAHNLQILSQEIKTGRTKSSTGTSTSALGGNTYEKQLLGKITDMVTKLGVLTEISTRINDLGLKVVDLDTDTTAIGTGLGETNSHLVTIIDLLRSGSSPYTDKTIPTPSTGPTSSSLGTKPQQQVTVEQALAYTGATGSARERLRQRVLRAGARTPRPESGKFVGLGTEELDRLALMTEQERLAHRHGPEHSRWMADVPTLSPYARYQYEQQKKEGDDKRFKILLDTMAQSAPGVDISSRIPTTQEEMTRYRTDIGHGIPEDVLPFWHPLSRRGKTGGYEKYKAAIGARLRHGLGGATGIGGLVYPLEKSQNQRDKAGLGRTFEELTPLNDQQFRREVSYLGNRLDPLNRERIFDTKRSLNPRSLTLSQIAQVHPKYSQTAVLGQALGLNDEMLNHITMMGTGPGYAGMVASAEKKDGEAVHQHITRILTTVLDNTFGQQGVVQSSLDRATEQMYGSGWKNSSLFQTEVDRMTSHMLLDPSNKGHQQIATQAVQQLSLMKTDPRSFREYHEFMIGLEQMTRDEYGPLKAEWLVMGENMKKSFLEGIASLPEDMRKIGIEAVDALAWKLRTGSPNKAGDNFTLWGQKMKTNFIKGIETMIGSMHEAGIKAVGALNSGLHTKNMELAGERTGASIVSGYSKGLTNKQSLARLDRSSRTVGEHAQTRIIESVTGTKLPHGAVGVDRDGNPIDENGEFVGPRGKKGFRSRMGRGFSAIGGVMGGALMTGMMMGMPQDPSSLKSWGSSLKEMLTPSGLINMLMMNMMMGGGIPGGGLAKRGGKSLWNKLFRRGAKGGIGADILDSEGEHVAQSGGKSALARLLGGGGVATAEGAGGGLLTGGVLSTLLLSAPIIAAVGTLGLLAWGVAGPKSKQQQKEIDKNVGRTTHFVQNREANYHGLGGPLSHPRGEHQSARRPEHLGFGTLTHSVYERIKRSHGNLSEHDVVSALGSKAPEDVVTDIKNAFDAAHKQYVAEIAAAKKHRKEWENFKKQVDKHLTVKGRQGQLIWAGLSSKQEDKLMHEGASKAYLDIEHHSRVSNLDRLNQLYGGKKSLHDVAEQAGEISKNGWAEGFNNDKDRKRIADSILLTIKRRLDPDSKEMNAKQWAEKFVKQYRQSLDDGVPHFKGASQALLTEIKKRLKFASPNEEGSFDPKQSSTNMVNSFIKGMKDTQDDLATQTKASLKVIVDYLGFNTDGKNKKSEDFGQSGKNIINSLVKGMGDRERNASDKVEEIGRKINTKIGTGGKFWQLGESIMKWTVQGIQDYITGNQSSLSALGQALAQAMGAGTDATGGGTYGIGGGGNLAAIFGVNGTFSGLGQNMSSTVANADAAGIRYSQELARKYGINVSNDRFSNDMDFGGQAGQKVYLPGSGKYTYLGNEKGAWGNLLQFSTPGGGVVNLPHLMNLANLKAGQTYRGGTEIGEVGDGTGISRTYWTGPHLALIMDRAAQNYFDKIMPKLLSSGVGGGGSVNAGNLDPDIRGWTKLINRASGISGTPAALIASVMEQESHGDPRALSGKGAQGLMQLMPFNDAKYGVRDPYDPWQNILGGAKMLASLIREHHGDVNSALYSYTGGYSSSQYNNPVMQRAARYGGSGGMGGGGKDKNIITTAGSEYDPFAPPKAKSTTSGIHVTLWGENARNFNPVTGQGQYDPLQAREAYFATKGAVAAMESKNDPADLIHNPKYIQAVKTMYRDWANEQIAQINSNLHRSGGGDPGAYERAVRGIDQTAHLKVEKALQALRLQSAREQMKLADKQWQIAQQTWKFYDALGGKKGVNWGMAFAGMNQQQATAFFQPAYNAAIKEADAKHRKDLATINAEEITYRIRHNMHEGASTRAAFQGMRQAERFNYAAERASNINKIQQQYWTGREWAMEHLGTHYVNRAGRHYDLAPLQFLRQMVAHPVFKDMTTAQRGKWLNYEHQLITGETMEKNMQAQAQLAGFTQQVKGGMFGGDAQQRKEMIDNARRQTAEMVKLNNQTAMANWQRARQRANASTAQTGSGRPVPVRVIGHCADGSVPGTNGRSGQAPHPGSRQHTPASRSHPVGGPVPRGSALVPGHHQFHIGQHVDLGHGHGGHYAWKNPHGSHTDPHNVKWVADHHAEATVGTHGNYTVTRVDPHHIKVTTHQGSYIQEDPNNPPPHKKAPKSGSTTNPKRHPNAAHAGSVVSLGGAAVARAATQPHGAVESSRAHIVNQTTMIAQFSDIAGILTDSRKEHERTNQLLYQLLHAQAQKGRSPAETSSKITVGVHPGPAHGKA